MDQIHHSLSRRLASAESYARSLFIENPSLSIDEAARVVFEYCHHNHLKALTKSAISAIRHETRSAYTHVMAIPRPAEVAVEANVKTNERNVEDRVSTHSERVAWLHDWALSHLGATVDQARTALRERFGMAIGTRELADTMKLARMLRDEEITMQSQRALSKWSDDQVPKYTVQELCELLRRAGIRKVESLDGSTFSVEFRPTKT